MSRNLRHLIQFLWALVMVWLARILYRIGTIYLDGQTDGLTDYRPLLMLILSALIFAAAIYQLLGILLARIQHKIFKDGGQHHAASYRHYRPARSR